MLVADPPTQLRRAVVRDRDDERSVLDLAAELEPDGRIELVGTVHRERVRRSSHRPHDLRDGGGIGAEVHVHVLDATALDLVEQHHRLEQVRRVHR